MPVCIYCKEPTSGDEPEAHPIPQALGTGDYALPSGWECGGCNAYFAANLDQNFCDHHHLAMLIAMWGIRGTDGRTRTAITPDFNFDPVNRHLTIRARRGEAEFKDGTLSIHSAGNRAFSNWKFSRGLHRIGLGVLALLAGADAVLPERYDRVRRYIRNPASRRVFWPYFQRITGGLVPKIHVGIATSDQATFFYINLVVSEFLVALDGDARVTTDGERHDMAVRSGAPVENPAKQKWLLFEGESPN